MDFSFTDEQRALRDTLERWVRKDYTFEKRREILKSKDGLSLTAWQQLADMGVLAVSLPEDAGGLGGSAVDTMVVMETLGRGMVLEPYVATIVLGAGLVARAGSAAQKAAILPSVADGKHLLALAHGEPGARYALESVATRARRDGDGWVLDGRKAVVLHGDCADTLIVSARTAGDVRDAAGISLFLVPADAAGVKQTGYATQDGQRAADIELAGVRVGAGALLGAQGEGLALVEAAHDRAIAALCAEAVGNMAALIEATVAYLKTRKQFGVPIGSFQALQHRAVEMYLHAEQARSMSYLAAAHADDPDRTARRRAISAAKTLVGQSARYVGQQAIQLHGGIGVTDELAVSHYFKRLTMIEMSFGNTDHHLALYGALLAA